MTKGNKELYFKKIGELTQEEFELLFNISTDINNPNFQEILKPIAEQSISDINIEEYKMDELNVTLVYLLGCITALKEQIPKTHIIVLFGESGCGKSHLVNLISKLKQMTIQQIEENAETLGFVSKEFETDKATIKELKEMADSISIIQKKTTRPARDKNQNKPEIEEGVPIEEVEKCDWTYIMAGNLYGLLKARVDKALKKGNAIAIVNDPSLKVVRQLKREYSSSLIIIQVLRIENKEEWVKLMQEDNRKSEEIAKRIETFGFSREMYNNIWNIDIPEVIFNVPEDENINKTLLIQLNGIIKRREKGLEGIPSYDEEREQ